MFESVLVLIDVIMNLLFEVKEKLKSPSKITFLMGDIKN